MDHLWDYAIVPLPASSTQEAPIAATEARTQEFEAPQSVTTRPKTARATAAAKMAKSASDRTSAQQADISTGGSARSSRQAGNQVNIYVSKAQGSSKQANMSETELSSETSPSSPSLKRSASRLDTTRSPLNHKRHKKTNNEIQTEIEIADHKASEAFRAILRQNPAFTQDLQQIWYGHKGDQRIFSHALDSLTATTLSNTSDNRLLASRFRVLEALIACLRETATSVEDLMNPSSLESRTGETRDLTNVNSKNGTHSSLDREPELEGDYLLQAFMHKKRNERS